MEMNQVVMLSKLFPEGMKRLVNKVELVECLTADPMQALLQLKEADAVLIGNQTFGGDLIERLPKLRAIAKQGSGYDNIDVRAATARGIPVVLSAGTNAASVAEHVIMMVLAANRNLRMYDNAVRAGNFSIRSACVSREVGGTSIGLIGFGRIGRAVARIASALEMRILVYDPYLPRTEAEKLGLISCENLVGLLSESDTVSIHVPLTGETRGLIGEKEIACMKPSAVLINCSRGNIVDERALCRALSEGRLFSAGIDVYASEPATADNPLFAFENVCVTPHSAALTQKAAAEMSRKTAEGLLAVLAGERWETVADPSVFFHPKWNSENQER